MFTRMGRSHGCRNPSVNHHYLPRHYLKGFTDERGMFYIYDKQKDMLFLSNPDSTFFEKRLNSLTFPSGRSSDSLESIYAFAEKKAWPSFNGPMRQRQSTSWIR
jgi:hypothetical protein